MWIDEADVYHYKARAYDPHLRRFLQADPIGYAAGMNIYAYVGGDPMNFVDPSGMLHDPNASKYYYDGPTHVVPGHAEQNFISGVGVIFAIAGGLAGSVSGAIVCSPGGPSAALGCSAVGGYMGSETTKEAAERLTKMTIHRMFDYTNDWFNMSVERKEAFQRHVNETDEDMQSGCWMQCPW